MRLRPPRPTHTHRRRAAARRRRGPFARVLGILCAQTIGLRLGHRSLGPTRLVESLKRGRPHTVEERMISIVLSNAIERIQYYQKTYPEDYDQVAAELKVVLALMEAQRRLLDTGPFSPWGRGQIHRLGKAIREVDLSAVLAAVDVHDTSSPAA